MSTFKKYWPFILIIALSLILALFFLFDWWPFLRGGYGWRWPYEQPQVAHLVSILPALGCLIIYLLGLYVLRAVQTAVYLLWCLLGALFIPLALLLWWGDPLEILFVRTASGLITGGFSVAAKTESAAALLIDWPQQMVSLKPESIHVALSMPGWPLVYHAFSKLLQAVPWLSAPLGMMLRPYLCHEIQLMNLSSPQIASAWLGILSPLWAALTAVPLYLLGRSAAGELVARKAVAWWPLVPSLAIFLGTLNTPTPLLATTIIFLLWTGLTPLSSLAGWRLAAAGALSALAITLSFAFVPLLLFAGIVALLVWQRDPGESWLRAFARPLRAGFLFAAGMVFIFAIYTLLARHTPLDVLTNSLEMHLDLNRRYWPWLWLHTWDFLIFAGLPAAGLFLVGLTHWSSPPIRQLARALALTLLIVIISGTARGETGRLWIFFMPVLLLVAADLLLHLPGHLRSGLILTQAVWLLVLFMVLPATGRGFTAPPTYAEVAYESGPGPVIAAPAQFGDHLQLEGFSSVYEEEQQAFVVDLQWRVDEALAAPYFFSAILVTPDGGVLPAVDWQPFDYQYPTTCWDQAQQPLVDRVLLPVGPSAPEGAYWLSLSAYTISPAGEQVRLAVTSPGSGDDTQVGLGPLIKSPIGR